MLCTEQAAQADEISCNRTGPSLPSKYLQNLVAVLLASAPARCDPPTQAVVNSLHAGRRARPTPNTSTTCYISLILNLSEPSTMRTRARSVLSAALQQQIGMQCS